VSAPSVYSHLFIVNPAAGKGTGARVIAPLEALIGRSGLAGRIVRTTGPGHATSLARESGEPVVVSVGGDGTVNEVVNGLIGTDKSMGILPAGSGNDFIKSVDIPRRLESAFAKCMTGNVQEVDVGTVSCGSPGAPVRLFLNGVGIGFDAAVAARTRRIRYLRGLPLYLMAVFQTLRTHTNPTLSINLDGTQVSGRHLLVAVGNGVCAGGGFYLTPRASVKDGLLDFCMIGDARVGRILRLMPLVLWGKHLAKKDIVAYSQGRNFELTAETPIYVHADGEVVGEEVKSVRIGLDARKLRILA
jgi:diacylglycerol kinase (ATP)